MNITFSKNPGYNNSSDKVSVEMSAEELIAPEELVELFFSFALACGITNQELIETLVLIRGIAGES